MEETGFNPCLQPVHAVPPLSPGGQKDPLEQEKANHSSILAWRIPMTEEPGGLQSMGSQRVIGENWCLRVEWTLKVLWSSALGEASVCSACPFQEASSLGSNEPQ